MRAVEFNNFRPSVFLAVEDDFREDALKSAVLVVWELSGVCAAAVLC